MRGTTGATSSWWWCARLGSARGELWAFTSPGQQSLLRIHAPLMVDVEAYGFDAYVMSVLPIGVRAEPTGGDQRRRAHAAVRDMGAAARAVQLPVVVSHLKTLRVQRLGGRRKAGRQTPAAAQLERAARCTSPTASSWYRCPTTGLRRRLWTGSCELGPTGRDGAPRRSAGWLEVGNVLLDTTVLIMSPHTGTRELV